MLVILNLTYVGQDLFIPYSAHNPEIPNYFLSYDIALMLQNGLSYIAVVDEKQYRRYCIKNGTSVFEVWISKATSNEPSSGLLTPAQNKSVYCTMLFTEIACIVGNIILKLANFGKNHVCQLKSVPDSALYIEHNGKVFVAVSRIHVLTELNTFCSPQ